MTDRDGWTTQEVVDIAPEDAIEEAKAIVAACRPLLAGRPPQAIGAALSELLATFFAAHHPEMREDLINETFRTTRQLIEPCEQEIFSTRERPDDWGPIRSWATQA